MQKDVDILNKVRKYGNITIDIYDTQVVSRRSQDRTGHSGKTIEEALEKLHEELKDFYDDP